jgi:protein-tyrosine phosphatase
MRSGFGPGVSIPSQVRYVGYVDLWTNQLGKTYIDRPVEIVEIQLEGLRDGLKVEVHGFVEEGRKIKRFHRFHRRERVEGNEIPPVPVRRHTQYPPVFPDDEEDKAGFDDSPETIPAVVVDRRKPSLGFPNRALTDPETISKAIVSLSNSAAPNPSLPSVILRPRKRVIVPTSDVNIDFERRALASYTGWTVMTSIAHIWFNVYFEGGHEHDSGVFEADWEDLDGIKGTWRKGTRAVDRIRVVWRYPTSPLPAGLEDTGAVVPGGPPLSGKIIPEPKPGEEVPEGHAADWRGESVIEGNDEETDVDSGAVTPAANEDAEVTTPKDIHQESRQQSADAQRESSGPLSVSAERSHARRQSAAQADVSLVNIAGNFETDSKENSTGDRRGNHVQTNDLPVRRRQS